MRVYVGQTRARKLIEKLRGLGFGECTSRGEYPPRRYPFFLDNGAFGDWKAQRVFDWAAFVSDFLSLRAASPPDFVVCPDIVAGGLDSLVYSLHWLVSLRFVRPDLRYYLAVQDGMTEDDVMPWIEWFDGVFVGGTLPWKIATGERWVRLAHAFSLPCHIGRVGNAKRVPATLVGGQAGAVRRGCGAAASRAAVTELGHDLPHNPRET